MIIWVIGLAGSGKTTFGKEIYNYIKQESNSTVFLDGDNFRNIIGNDLGHDLKSREINSRRMKNFCSFLDNQNINVVCCILSIFPEHRLWCKKHFKSYYEIYIKVPFEELKIRDQKKLYSQGLKGEIKNVVGIDLEFPEPISPDFVIDNTLSISNLKEQSFSIFETIKSENNGIFF